MTLCKLIKMKCCLVGFLAGVTGILLIIGHNRIYTGITGTIALVYGIALLMLVAIAFHERLCRDGEADCGSREALPNDGSA